MHKFNFEETWKLISSQFDTVTKTGRKSQIRSRHLIQFLTMGIQSGISALKKMYPAQSYKSYMTDLKKCGITEELINEEYEKKQFKKKNQRVEFVELVFTNQVPEDYKQPKSKYSLKDIME